MKYSFAKERMMQSSGISFAVSPKSLKLNEYEVQLSYMEHLWHHMESGALNGFST